MRSNPIRVAESQKAYSKKVEQKALKYMELYFHPVQLGNCPCHSWQEKACYVKKLIHVSPALADKKHSIENRDSEKSLHSEH